MTARRAIAALLAGTVLAGCAAEPADIPDCDSGDRAKHEQPDCGFTDKGVYREWSWVKAGKTTPPAGWSASKEKKTVTSTKKAKP